MSCCASVSEWVSECVCVGQDDDGENVDPEECVPLGT